MRYSRLNNLVGLGIFLIAAFTYLATREASASWWDCGEFLSAAYKLEVVHEPGSPLFLLIGRLFSLLAGSPQLVAPLINSSSALASAATILFLFWTITLITKRIVLGSTAGLNSIDCLIILGAGVIGSLAYCFSDTFWFSAVESEVYALSSLCTALVVWAIFKWDETESTNPYASRYLLLIAYVMGLSIGVHLLNLLTIPALTLVYYFHYYKPSFKGVFVAASVSILLLAGILYGLIPLTISYAAKADIFAVNTLNLPFNSGAGLFFLLLALVLSSLVYFSRKLSWANVHSASLALVFIFIGYSSYTMVIVRAAADPPLNNSRPADFISLLGYLGREQYQESPLLYGPDFAAEILKIDEGEMRYRKGDSRYVTAGPKPVYVYDPAALTFFPRMWDSEHAADYRHWIALGAHEKPSFADNLNFFFSYQVYYMYLRYFLWNFAGRQNDTPSTSPNPTKGNWLTGFHFIDALMLGNQDKVPFRLKENKANNKLYLLPLLLGFAGLIFQYRKDKNGFVILLLLFLFTGLAVAVYLNMPPGQPRERDYAFSGSFYAFSIWIGLGAAGLSQGISTFKTGIVFPALCLLTCFALVPLLMSLTEWNDHDRSNRYTARDFAANYLRSCAPQAILFTYGDNETYPLWYAQEVEGIRPDIRVINLSLFDGSWSIDKARNKENSSLPLPITWKHDQYIDGTRDYLYYKKDTAKNKLDLGQLLAFMASDKPDSKNEEGENYLPAKRFILPVDPKEVTRTGTVPIELRDSITRQMAWTFNHNTISKGQLIILDILVHNHWQRPIYFCATMGTDSFMGMDAYMRQQGIVYQLVPLNQETHSRYEFPMDEAATYNDLMSTYRWGNLDAGIHLDDQTTSFAGSFKEIFMSLAQKLYKENKKDSCLRVLNRMKAVIPTLPSLSNEISEEDFSDVRAAEMYYGLGEVNKATLIMNKQLSNTRQYLDFAWSQGKRSIRYYDEIITDGNSILEEMLTVSRKFKQASLSASIKRQLEITDRRYSL